MIAFQATKHTTFTITFLLILILTGLAACKGGERNTGITMSQNVMDRPEVLQVLFHPRATPKTTAPAGATDIDISVAPEIIIGNRLYGDTKDVPVILFFHGNGETVTDYDEIGPMYNQVGLNVLVTDFRGYGWSTGTPTSSNMLSDAHALYTGLRNWLYANQYSGPIFLMGRSLGSACAIELATEFNDEISGIIIESGFAETLPLAQTLGLDIAGLGITEEETFNNKGKIESVTKPTFMLHGRMDDLIPVWQAERLMAASGARSKELQIVPGADHNSLIAIGGMLYFQAIKQFVDKTLGANDWRTKRRAYRAQ